MSDFKDDGYRNKYAQFRQEKKNIKQKRKDSYRNKNSFIYDNDSSNINDIPPTISDDKDNKLILNKDENVKLEEIKDNVKDVNIDEEEYEEFTPDYFEPVAYVKK